MKVEVVVDVVEEDETEVLLVGEEEEEEEEGEDGLSLAPECPLAVPSGTAEVIARCLCSMPSTI